MEKRLVWAVGFGSVVRALVVSGPGEGGLCYSHLEQPQDWKMSVFIPIPKKGNGKECSYYRTIALISHASEVMLKFFKLGFNSM